MCKILGAALIGLTVAGGAIVAGTAQAQPYGYYAPAPGYYDNGYYRPAPRPYNDSYYNNGYYRTPSHSYYNGSDAAGLAGALIGSVLAPAYGAYGSGVPVDRFGPDPNGMIAPDGHRIKCKIRTGEDNYGRYRTFRQCY